MQGRPALPSSDSVVANVGKTRDFVSIFLAHRSKRLSDTTGCTSKASGAAGHFGADPLQNGTTAEPHADRGR